MPAHLHPSFHLRHMQAHTDCACVCAVACRPIAVIYLPLKKTSKGVEEWVRGGRVAPPSVDYLNFLAEGPC